MEPHAPGMVPFDTVNHLIRACAHHGTSLVAQMVEASAYNGEDQGSVPGSGRSPREENGTPLQYSCLEKPMGGEAWLATVHGVTKSRTRLSDFTSPVPIKRCN